MQTDLAVDTDSDGVTAEASQVVVWLEGFAWGADGLPGWAEDLLAGIVQGMIEDSVETLAELKAKGEQVYAITNFSREKWAECLIRFPFLQSFDGVIVSAHERLLKPDPAIYNVLLERYGLDAGECIFVDDSARNVEAARAVGMQAVHFVEPIDLRAQLRSLGANL